MSATSLRVENVKLSWFELIQAGNVGVSRNVSALRDGRPLEEGREDSAFETHIHGAIGECALAKMLGVYWAPAVGRLDTDTGDVRKNHVKATTRSNGRLIVRPHDPDDFPFVFVTLRLPIVTLHGWKWGIDAKQDEFWEPVDKPRGIHRAAWFVPQRELEPIAELPDKAVELLQR